VFQVIIFSIAIAVLIAVRVVWTHQQAGKPLGRGLEIAGIIGFAIVSSSYRASAFAGFVRIGAARFPVIDRGEFGARSDRLSYKSDRVASVCHHPGNADDFALT
jgi:hypothetical protein